MKRQPDYQGEILALGWNPGFWQPDVTKKDCQIFYRATHGGFSTPYRADWKTVLDDVKKIREKETKV